jgi:hypothetical protein
MGIGKPEPRWNKPYRTEDVHCSDRFARRLANGIEAYVALWFVDDGDYYLDVIFRTPKGMSHGEARDTVGPIADEIVEVLDRHSAPGMDGFLQWGEFEPLEEPA